MSLSINAKLFYRFSFLTIHFCDTNIAKFYLGEALLGYFLVAKKYLFFCNLYFKHLDGVLRNLIENISGNILTVREKSLLLRSDLRVKEER